MWFLAWKSRVEAVSENTAGAFLSLKNDFCVCGWGYFGAHPCLEGDISWSAFSRGSLTCLSVGFSPIYGARQNGFYCQNFAQLVKDKLGKPEILQGPIKEKLPDLWKFEFPHRFPYRYAYQFGSDKEQILQVVINGLSETAHMHKRACSTHQPQMVWLWINGPGFLS